jgi:uncharacterized protein (TIGR00730 family)
VRRVCVFCGSSPGHDPRYAASAAALARELVSRGIGVVFGGGSIGLMGVLADQALAGGGSVTGVIPHGLAARELAHRGVADMRVVPTMHARKALMAELADGFVALPGGIGTLDELFEIVTWSQLGIHRKPIGVLNVAGYYDPLEPGASSRPRTAAWCSCARSRRRCSTAWRPTSPRPPRPGSPRKRPSQRCSAAAASAPAVPCSAVATVCAVISSGSRRGGTTTGPSSGGVRRMGMV